MSRHDDAVRLHKEAAARFREEELRADNDRLCELLRRKLMTVGVGALAAFENGFGYLWGEGKPPQDRTEGEREWLALYQKVRDEVFDRLNRQVRAVQDELALHVVEFVGGRAEFRAGPSASGPAASGRPGAPRG